MSRARVAPTLATNLRTPPSGWEGTEELAAMRSELRALLAVASAARWYGDMSKRMAPGFKCVCEGQACCAGCSLDRALARLSRVSRKGARAGRSGRTRG